jgi:hypothetical protein
MTGITLSDRKLFRKSLVIPAEHGSWSWLLVPFLVGAAVAGRLSVAGLAAPGPIFLTLIGGLCAFLMRQPASIWFRIRQGRANPATDSLAAGWTLGLALVAGLCLAGLLAMGRVALLWLVLPFAAVLLLYLAAARSGRAGMRSLWMELIGAIGLGLMAPATVIAATGRLNGLVWALWGLIGIQNALGVLYVRLRLADTHHKPAHRPSVLWGHAAGLAAVITAGLLHWTPLLAAIPFVGVLLRALWAVQSRRPVTNVRRFGFTEVGVELLSGAWMVASYWLW